MKKIMFFILIVVLMNVSCAVNTTQEKFNKPGLTENDKSQNISTTLEEKEMLMSANNSGYQDCLTIENFELVKAFVLKNGEDGKDYLGEVIAYKNIDKNIELFYHKAKDDNTNEILVLNLPTYGSIIKMSPENKLEIEVKDYPNADKVKQQTEKVLRTFYKVIQLLKDNAIIDN